MKKPNQVETNVNPLNHVPQAQTCPQKPVPISPEEPVSPEERIQNELKSHVDVLGMVEELFQQMWDQVLFLENLKRTALIHGPKPQGDYVPESRQSLENGAIGIEAHLQSSFHEAMRLLKGARNVIAQCIKTN